MWLDGHVLLGMHHFGSGKRTRSWDKALLLLRNNICMCCSNISGSLMQQQAQSSLPCHTRYWFGSGVEMLADRAADACGDNIWAESTCL